MIAVRHLNSDPETERTAQYPPTLAFTANVRAQYPLECTSHITLLLPAQVLNILKENSHRTKHFPRHLRFTKTLYYLLFSLSVSGVHTLTHTERTASKTTPPTPNFSMATTWRYSLKLWVYKTKKTLTVLGASMQHCEPAHKASAEVYCFTLQWASVALQTGSTWMLHVTVPAIKRAHSDPGAQRSWPYTHLITAWYTQNFFFYFNFFLFCFGSKLLLLTKKGSMIYLEEIGNKEKEV